MIARRSTAGKGADRGSVSDGQTNEKYRAFISYSHHDEAWVKWFHRRLERFRVPSDPKGAAKPRRRRATLRPIFRDREELPASADLGARLRTALDQSQHLLVVGSPTAARSVWVNAEVQYYVARGRTEDILAIVVDGEAESDAARPRQEHQALPPALSALPTTPYWVDARKHVKRRSDVVRIAAGVLGRSFDELWRRDRRRRRRLVVTWMLSILLIAVGFGWAFWRQDQISDRSEPQNQVTKFESYLWAHIRALQGDGANGTAVEFRILATVNLNHDNRLDFVIFNASSGFCGSGGCSTEVYLANDDGSYEVVLDLFGHSGPHVRESSSNPFAEVVATHYMAGGEEPILSVYYHNGVEYQLSHLEFCDGIWFEYCDDPLKILAFDSSERSVFRVADDASIVRRPRSDAGTIDLQVIPTVLGRTADGTWYLVQMVKSTVGFVHADQVITS